MKKIWPHKMGRSVGVIILAIIILLGSSPLAFAANYNMANINLVDSQVKVKENGETHFLIKINYTYSTYLDWNLGVKSASDVVVKAAGKIIPATQYQLSNDNSYIRLMVDRKLFYYQWEISFTSKKAITIDQRENLKWLAVAQASHGWIDNVQVRLISAVPFKETNRRAYRLYAYHGVETSGAEMVDPKTVSYHGENLGPAAGFSIEASWPNNSLHFSFIKKLLLSMSGMSLLFWIFFALMLPVAAIICLIILYIRSRRQVAFHKVQGMRNNPPTDLSPLMVGILVDKKIYSRTIMAAILDLCQRGYLIIIKDNKQFVFGKRKLPDDNLRQWEKLLYGEMVAEEVWTRESEVKRKINKEFFSPGMRAIYEQAYENVTNLGYFDTNPHFIRVKYKIVGIILYLLSIAGVLWVILTMRSPYFLIPLVGVLIATMILIKFAYLIPVQSQLGLEARLEWIRFKNYLGNKETMLSSDSISGIFYDYLPFALAMGVEKQWAERFRHYRMVMPSWFMSGEIVEIEAEDTVNQILTAISVISSQMSQLHGPAVK